MKLKEENKKIIPVITADITNIVCGIFLNTVEAYEFIKGESTLIGQSWVI